MSAPVVTFTLDLEDLRTSPTQEPRLEGVTDRLLDRLAELGVVGTVFCVGELVRRHPRLLARIAAEGHELAVHGLQHVPVDLLGPERFRSHTLEARSMLEDVSGRPVVGYRAPQFSLVPETFWATEILSELGFRYSSSVMPAPSPLYGWAGAPRHPFLWPSGLIELPCPLVDIGGRPIPFLGGTYLRLLPESVRRRGFRESGPSSVLWTYCHPWEFDPDEHFYVFEHGGVLASVVGWTNRKGMMGRLERLLASGGGPTMGDVAASLDELPVFRPASTEPERGMLRGVLRRRPSAA
jgi:polysaccharide deacetylase family protein (PEP-CTERM system associated)